MPRSRKRTRKPQRRLLLFGAVGMAAVVLSLTILLVQKRQTSVYGETKGQVEEKESDELHRAEEEISSAEIEDKGDSEKSPEEAVLKSIQVQGPEETVEIKNLEESELQKQVAELAAKWNRQPVDSEVISYDKQTGVYQYSKEQDGRALNQERLVKDILKAANEEQKTGEVEAVFETVPAKRTREQAKEQYRVIGTFTTKLTNNKNRNKNVTLAAEAIDGLVLKPGEEFSFNNTTGNRTKEKGYQPAGAYRNGVLIEEPGGGVCQVSTTLYHSIIEAGFKTTERNAHSFAPSYVEKGQDAMVSFDGYAGPDLKFVNTSTAPIVLRAAVQGLELKLSVVGIPVLEDGVKVSIRSEKVRDTDPPAPVYEENTALPYGTETVTDPGQNGSVWKSYRVLTKNGKVLEEKPLHNSYYKSKPGVIQGNLTAPPAAEVQPEESAAELESTQGEAGQAQESIQPQGPGQSWESSHSDDMRQSEGPGQPAESGSPLE